MTSHESQREQSGSARWYDSACYTDTVIEYPIEKVWPHAFNINSWLVGGGFDSQTMAGEQGKAGHLIKILAHGMGDETPRPHYHFCKLTEVIPHRLFTIKGFSEEGGSYGRPQHRSYENFLLTEENGHTRVSLIYNVERLIETAEDKDRIEAIVRDEKKTFANMDTYWDKLKQLVKSSHE